MSKLSVFAPSCNYPDMTYWTWTFVPLLFSFAPLFANAIESHQKSKQVQSRVEPFQLLKGEIAAA
jgi:hypothetical protein